MRLSIKDLETVMVARYGTAALFEAIRVDAMYPYCLTNALRYKFMCEDGFEASCKLIKEAPEVIEALRTKDRIQNSSEMMIVGPPVGRFFSNINLTKFIHTNHTI